MGLLLREALIRLCRDCAWSYAVFWKRASHNPALLVWGEGQYEMGKQFKSSGIPLQMQNSQMLLTDWDVLCTAPIDRSSQLKQEQDRMAVLVNGIMMPQVHVLGEGIVGHAAFVGNHRWIHFNTESLAEAEVQHQLLAGIQTIAVIPVLPYGVVQLGSIQMVIENLEFVNHVNSLFAQLGNVPGALSSNTEYGSSLKVQMPVSLGVPVTADRSRNSCSSLRFPPVVGKYILLQGGEGDNLASSTQLAVQNSKMQSNQPVQQHFFCSGNSNSASVFASAHNTETPILGSLGSKAVEALNDSIVFPLLGDTESPRTGMRAFVSNQCGSGRTVDSHQSCRFVEAAPSELDGGVIPMLKGQNHSNIIYLNSGEFLQNRKHDGFKCTGIEKTLRQKRGEKAFSKFVDSPLAYTKEPIPWHGCITNGSVEDKGHLVNNLKGNIGSCNAIVDENGVLSTISGESLKCPIGIQPDRKSGENPSNTNARSALPRCDLFEALGLDFNPERCHGLNDMLLHQGVVDEGNLKEFLPKVDVPPLFATTNMGVSESGVFSDSGTDYLLDAVVSNIHSCVKEVQDDSLSCKTTLTKTSSSIHSPTNGGIAVPEQNQWEPSRHSQTLAKIDLVESRALKTSGNFNNTEECSQTDNAYKSQISSWVENGLNMNCGTVSTASSKRGDDMGKPNHKRCGPGENPRPRPRDRQMIQDRVKELREIIPSGAKCSIDALLERTIKHMVFLQNVTKHADKLKQTKEPNLTKNGDLFLKDNSGIGKTLALEVNSQSMVCPIIVEDLKEPRQMRIEVLCEERSLFLEIADIIRGLDLTILKGVMEASDNKIWARFIVEANKDVKRMNVFLSLVHLLEQTMKSSRTLPSKDFDCSNVGHNIYYQATFPATGLANAFR